MRFGPQDERRRSRPSPSRTVRLPNRPRARTALATNERAIKAYERCGFKRDATLPERSYKDGEFVDRVVMSVTREEFEKLRAEASSSVTD